MSCNIVLSENFHPSQETLELIKTYFMRDISMYIEMLNLELTYSTPKFLVTNNNIVRVESDREKELHAEIRKVQKQYTDKYKPYISF